jgi:putative hemolysin
MKIRALWLIFCLLLTGCTLVTSQAADIKPTVIPTVLPTMAALPNPATVYCIEQGGKSEIRTNADGSQTGYCIFADGSECDEWAYYRAECSPWSASVPPTETASVQEWNTYSNEYLGYSFQYPPDALVTTNDDPLKGLQVSGSGMGSEVWTIAHPNDRPEYLPPQDVDLQQWLSDHYLLGENQQPDVQIAGTTAVHLRHARSSQSYADDRYFFTHDGQLYQILIGHTGENEDWELDNRFLQSFQFEGNTPGVSTPTQIPTAVPIDASYYQGFWTYTHPMYGFSIMLPEDWVVDETTTGDPVMNDHVLILHPKDAQDVSPSIRMSFRSVGEDALLWPTGVGQGEFIEGGTLDIAGSPARRVYLVCPEGQIQSIWYQGGENQPNILRGNLEFSFIYTYSGNYCQGDRSLTGKTQLVGEMIIASLNMP